MRIVGWTGLVLLTISCSPVFAELIPPIFPNLDWAPEILDVDVILVSKRIRYLESDADVTQYRINVLARVREVRCTKTGLKVGSTIIICYDTHQCKGPTTPPGSAYHPILERGKTYEVHLSRNMLRYRPYDVHYGMYEKTAAEKK